MLRNISHTFAFRTLSAVINLAIAVILSQYLGPAGKGSQSIILTTISIILIFSNLVGGATLVYLVPRFKISLLLAPSYAWSLVMGVLAYLLLVMTKLVAMEFVVHICILSVINSFLSIHSNILIGQQRIRESNWLILLQSVILVTSLLIAFWVLDPVSVKAYLDALYVSSLICLIVSGILIRKSFPGLKLFPLNSLRPVVLEMFRYGFQNQVAHITQLMSFRMSFYILEEYKGIGSVGIYSNGVSLAESIWLIAKSMALVQYSWVSNSNDREASARLSLQMVKAGMILSLLLIIPLLILPSKAYIFILGVGFEEVKSVIWTLVPGVVLYNMSILFGHYFSGTGRYYMNTRISSAGFLISLALYLYFIPRYDILGAGIATSLSYVATSLLFLWFFAKEYRGWYKEVLPGVKDFRDLLALVKRKS